MILPPRSCASPQPQQQVWRVRKIGSSSSTIRALSVENVFQAAHVVPKQRCPWNLELGRLVISAHCEVSQTSLAPLCLLELTCLLICLSYRTIGCLKARNMSYTFLYSSSSHGKSVINWSLNYTKYSFYCTQAEYCMHSVIWGRLNLKTIKCTKFL